MLKSIALTDTTKAKNPLLLQKTQKTHRFF